MTSDLKYDVIIAGGGLAGLAAAILIAQQEFSVAVIEKDSYPVQKVCGEYISLESWDFVHSLGLDLTKMKVPIIKTLELSSVKGKITRQSLPLGGFTISREKLDHRLAIIARRNKVTVIEGTKIQDINFADEQFMLDAGSRYHSTSLICAYGKRSNLDVKWKRPFIERNREALDNYIGVKYHISGEFEKDVIGLHLFEDGYCGIVMVDESRYNLCYLTTANNLKKCNGDISVLEEKVLSRNPRLASILTSAQRLFKPIVISQISFEKKEPVLDHMLMTGDAAGMITPLCGNGMSMAFHSAKLAAQATVDFLRGNVSRKESEGQYTRNWNRHFANRMRAGRFLQSVMLNRSIANSAISILQSFPSLTRKIISLTHGKRF